MWYAQKFPRKCDELPHTQLSINVTWSHFYHFMFGILFLIWCRGSCKNSNKPVFVLEYSDISIIHFMGPLSTHFKVIFLHYCNKWWHFLAFCVCTYIKYIRISCVLPAMLLVMPSHWTIGECFSSSHEVVSEMIKISVLAQNITHFYKLAS